METRRRTQAAEAHAELLNTLVRGALVSSGEYEERVLFEEYFPAPEAGSGEGEASGDANVDLDYSGVDFGIPTEGEMQILQRMLADNTVTVSDVTGPEEFGQAESDLPEPREIAPADIEQDREWV